MLFVVNSVFDKDIKESTTKENILKMMPEIYENADDEQILKMLPHRTYKDLERLIEYIKTSNDIKSFFYKREHPDIRYLEEAMIIVMRAKHLEYNYFLNSGVVENLSRLFSKENNEIAKRYGEELDKKLKEEVSEYLADYSVEEMADVMEVIYAILEYRGTSMEEVEKARIKKRNRKGAFKNKVFKKTLRRIKFYNEINR